MGRLTTAQDSYEQVHASSDNARSYLYRYRYESAYTCTDLIYLARIYAGISKLIPITVPVQVQPLKPVKDMHGYAK